MYILEYHVNHFSSFIVPPPVDSVSVTITSVSDTEVEIVVTWEPSVEYVSV